MTTLSSVRPNTNRPTEPIALPDIVEWSAAKLGLLADHIQAQVLRAKGKNGILNCSRQWGKSTVAAAMAVYQAVHSPGSLTLVVSTTQRQAAELVTKARAFLRMLGLKPKGDGVHKTSINLRNGSRILVVPASEATARGYSAVSLLLIDEAARMSDDAYLALRPSLAVSGGKVWLLSTPNGKQGFFWEQWKALNSNPDDEWVSVSVTADDCPRIPKDWLRKERGKVNSRWFAQEYQCQFVDTTTNVFDRDLIEACIRKDIKPLKL